MIKNIISFKTQLLIHAALAEVITIDSPGHCHYNDPSMNDDTLAAAQPFPCTKFNVRYVRTESFGQLTASPKPTPIQIAQLETRVSAIEASHANLILVVNGLTNARLSSNIKQEAT